MREFSLKFLSFSQVEKDATHRRPLSELQI
jgi:hypothetical protein